MLVPAAKSIDARTRARPLILALRRPLRAAGVLGREKEKADRVRNVQSAEVESGGRCLGRIGERKRRVNVR